MRYFVICLMLFFCLNPVASYSQTFSGYTANKNDITILKGYAAVLARAGVCEVPIEREFQRVLMWVEIKFQKDAPLVMEEIFFPDLEANASIQKSQASGEDCQLVLQLFKTTRWP